MSNQQVYDHHDQIMRDQDDQLDRLGESIGRQHQLSIQIGDELDGHVALLDGMDGDVDRHQSRLDNAKRRIDKIRRSAGENWSMMTIIGLIIVLVILIVLLK
jgi:syntaxin 8